MAHIAQVKQALKQGDKKQAMRLLKSILKENPTADAWYMAARLTDDRDKQRQYLKRALMLDSNHRKAKDLYRELGGQQIGSNRAILQMLYEEISRTGENSRLLGSMTPQQRFFIASGLSILMIVSMFGLLSAVFYQPSPPEFGPEPSPHVMLSAQPLMDYFISSSLPVVDSYAIELTDEEKVIEHAVDLPFDIRLDARYTLILTDTVTDYEVQVYVYDSHLSARTHQGNLEETAREQSQLILSHNNVNIVYPAALDTTLVQNMEQIVNQAPVS